MLQYILECIAFQLVFLIIYDLFLKRETFFQWNRLYLIGTYTISLVLPWIKIEAMKVTLPETFQAYPEYLWNRNDSSIIATTAKEATFSISWEYAVLFGGMFLTTLLFGYKLHQIYTLRQKGEVHYFKEFTRVIVTNSSMAFSFFKSVFLGDQVIKKEHESIVQHELVHVRQRHTYDLLFFELMRIAGWFNPLVYVYQSRVSELHEFIADAQVGKGYKKEQYQLLLSEVFQTRKISFINQFFKTSLIKKRIVMLTKEKSKQIIKLKYVLLIPILLGMLFYTSCELEENTAEVVGIQTVADVQNLSLEEETEITAILTNLSKRLEPWEYTVKDSNTELRFVNTSDDSYITGLNGEKIRAKMIVNSTSDISVSDIFGKNNPFDGVPFGIVEEVPIFPGCEDDGDLRACFNRMLQKHVSRQFRYPQKAKEMGVQGRVNTIFVIAEDGTIQNIKMRGPDALLENEVYRIINRLPRMTPGKVKGKAVKVPYSIPITFRLDQTNFDNFSNKKQPKAVEVNGSEKLLKPEHKTNAMVVVAYLTNDLQHRLSK